MYMVLKEYGGREAFGPFEDKESADAWADKLLLTAPGNNPDEVDVLQLLSPEPLATLEELVAEDR